MHIAVVGSGISGNLAARLLSTEHDVELFECASHLGGHAQTVDVEAYGKRVAADVGFMVLNRRTYPNFCRMLDLLEVDTQPSDMSLSVRCLRSGLEYQGSSLNGIFSQRSNLLRPSFYRMLKDILRFNRLASGFCNRVDDAMTLGEFLNTNRLGSEFREHYLIPMSAAIWSSDPSCLESFPARFILGFLRNHGLLQLRDRPQWLTIARRSRDYVAQLLKPLEGRIHLSSEISRVSRVGQLVRVSHSNGQSVDFDHVVMATHADQTLALMSDADEAEINVLEGFPYQKNTGVLHTDETVLPSHPRAWASWNYHIPKESSNQVSVSYDLNRLQTLGLPGPLCLTLNANCEIDPKTVLKRFEFSHPVFSKKSIDSQQRFDEINGSRGISFCGAYWGYGFHEDGVNSALAVAQRFGLSLDDLVRPSRTQLTVLPDSPSKNTDARYSNGSSAPKGSRAPMGSRD